MRSSKLVSGALAALVLVPGLPAFSPDAGREAGTVSASAEAAAMETGVHAPGPVMMALLKDVQTVEGKLTSLAEAMSAEAFAWRPDEGVRSASEVVMHVAADNYFIPTAAGTAAPASTGIRDDSYASVQAYEGRSVSRDEAMAELKASFEHLRGVMEAVDEASLNEPLELFGQEFTGLELWILTTTHLHEHLGQLIAYARTNEVTPPWSR